MSHVFRTPHTLAWVLESFSVAAAAGRDEGLQRVLEWLGGAATLLTAVLGAIALVGIVRSLYRKTAGRRRDRYRRLERLGTNAQVSFFSSVLGEPPAMRRRELSTVTRFGNDGSAYQEPKTWVECVWIDRDFYVHVVADEEETVHAYSVTTRSKRFRPTFRPPGGTSVEHGFVKRLLRFSDIKPNPKVKLAKTRFHELGRPEHAASWIGAHNLHYFEAYWGANPGLYQHFVYSINDAGHGAWECNIPFEQMSTFSWGFSEAVVDPQLRLMGAALAADYEETQAQELALPRNDVDEGAFDDDYAYTGEQALPRFYEAFRRRARINTYTVIGPELPLDDYPFFTPPPENYPTVFGPSSVRTRTLAGEQSK